MMTARRSVAVLLVSAAAGSAAAQGAGRAAAPRFAAHVVVPQIRAFAPDARPPAVAVERVRARVEIVDRAAETTLEVAVRSSAGRLEEAELLVPVPEGAVVSRFLFEGAAAEATARVLPRDEARRTYESIVSKLRDPALVEFAGLNLVRSSVFPVPPGGTQRVRLTYEHLLEADGHRLDYALPRSEILSAAGVPWEIDVRVRSKVPLAALFSPTHAASVEREGPGSFRVRVGGAAAQAPGPFRLSALAEGEGVTASLFAYPDPKIGGGYFLLLAGVPPRAAGGAAAIPREVTLVLDRSGSMRGTPMEQARAAAARVLDSLGDGDYFNIVDYATSVSSFAERPVPRDTRSLEEARRYLASMQASGGTNIHDALVEALRPPVAPGCLSMAIFFTDGLPTIGTTPETAIREAVERGNPHRRRVFTVGVGTEVNAPLLDRVAEATRGAAAYILPGEDIEVKVARLARRLAGPVLADAELAAVEPDGTVTTRRAQELMPERLPDLFEGDPIVIAGRYRDGGPLRFRLRGNVRGETRTFTFAFPLERATTRNAFVARLWASRRIGTLVDQVRQMGAGLARGQGVPSDPRFRELTDEIVRLSTEFGILTEYTAFLALEGTNLNDWSGNGFTAGTNLNNDAQLKRSGYEAISQSGNVGFMKGQTWLNGTNRYVDQRGNRVEIATVQQVADRAFYRRGNRWVDARVYGNGKGETAEETVEIGSEAYRSLLERLASEGRAALLAQPGEVLVEVEGRNVLVR